ncbi:ROK family protein [Paenibacillus lemnae]|uniref:ROK family protein n=1 Tax=Paenibacillus lemnae TaxID=1330551 RepID=A0A848M5N5_PAELE|nr:ROK family protein [Paenibacillus lemnae]
MNKVRIGLDIGGTNTVIGMFDEQHQLISKHVMRTASDADNDYTGYLNRLDQEIKRMMHMHRSDAVLSGIGAGVPGHLDLASGTVLRAPNLGWYDVKLVSDLSSRWQVPVSIDNDVRMYAWGEYTGGAAKGLNSVICITLGTGIAAGVIVDGHLIRGAHGYAGEIGHDPVEGNMVPCKCGKQGCLETIASASGLARLAEEAVQEGRHSLLREYAGTITARHVHEAAVSGDKLACDIFAYAGEVLGKKLTTMIYLLDPEMIVVGGGAANAGDMLLSPIRNTIQQLYPKAHRPEVTQGQLGDSAGLYGAVMSLSNAN